jgi:sigma-B regulation protein RsbU (phosphoserine phosphatase)
MSSDFLGRAGFHWRRLSRLSRAALGAILLYGLVWLIRLSPAKVPESGLPKFLLFTIGFLFYLSLGYFSFRLLAWARHRLLWSLRNRLIVAYVFIAVVPVLLLLVMVVLSASVIYSQLGAYLLNDDLQLFVEKVADAAEDVAATVAAQGPSTISKAATLPPGTPGTAAVEPDLPGLRIEMNTEQEMLSRQSGPRKNRFAGIVQSGDKLLLMAVSSRRAPAGPVVISATVPVTPELVERLAPFLGPIQFVVTGPADEGSAQGSVFRIGNRRFRTVGRIGTRKRTLQAAANWLDIKVEGVSKLEAVTLRPGPKEDPSHPVFAFFSARPSQLNGRLFSSLGELGGLYFQVLIAVGVIFLVIEVAALVTGIVLTRTITHAVADLYRATRDVQAGDLTHRVRVQQKDQLGALGESFNSMTSSISALIEEQRQRQRLENELAIAREVQAQLFPRNLPSLPGIQLDAVCRAARVVSGDYYDFIGLGPTRVGIAIADISGKGISAALLMASLQAALRSQVLLDGDARGSTSELVSRLNRHLFLNSSEDRYATLFYAVYDAATRTLCYTNAGHLPPLYIAGDKLQKLEDGGTVVGLFDNCAYEQGTIQMEPGSLLLAYSDGLTEPENVYGEEFGARRLAEVAMRHPDASAHALAEALVTAAEEWAGTPEQADDMTVVVARLDEPRR